MNHEELSTQVELSKKNKATTIPLKHFVFTAVRAALIKHYSENYSIRCLQSSVGIQKLMDDFGIKNNDV